MNPTELGAGDLAGLIRERSLSALEAVDAHIARIERDDREINAFVVRRFDEARAEARAADTAGPEDRSRTLHGVPISIKECFDLTGTATTAGITTLAGTRAAADAEAVRRLRDAGAIVLGKTNVAQYLLYAETDNPIYGRTNNPWDLDRSPAGSSGGEGAALAAGFSALGLGTDIGGSIRAPAHACGVFGFKPTPALVPLAGTAQERNLAHLSGIPDAAGPLATSVADLRLAMEALGTPLPAGQVRGLTVGFYEWDGYFKPSPAIRRAVREAAAILESAGVEVVEFAPPAVEEAMAVYYGLFVAPGAAPYRKHLAGSRIDPRIRDLLQLAGLPAAARPLVEGGMRLAGQRETARLVAVARPRDEAGLAALLARRDGYRRRFAAACERMGIDALLGPASSLPALTHGASRFLGAAAICYPAVYNLLAWPAGAVPVTTVQPGEESERPRSRDRVHATARRVDEGSAGLPVAVQIAAPAGRDGIVLDLMAAVEAGVPRGRPRPPAPAGRGARGTS